MSRLSKNIVYNLAGQSVLVLIGFVAVRYIFRLMPADAFGLIFFALTVNGILVALLDLGISSTIVREVAIHHEREMSQVNAVVRSASLLFWLGYIACVVALIFVAPALTRYWLHLADLQPADATAALRILGTGALLALPRALYASILRGFQHFGWQNAIDVFAAVVQQAGIVVVLLLGGRLNAVAAWLAFSFGLSVAGYILVAGRLVPASALVPGWSTAAIRRTIRFSSHMMGISAMAMTHTQADKLLISKILPIAAFGPYGFVSSVVSRASLLAGGVSQASLPSLSALYARGEREHFLPQYHKLNELLFITSAPPLAAIAYAVMPLFPYIFNRPVAVLIAGPTALLAAGYYLNATLTASYVFSLAAGRPQIATRSNAYALFITLPLTALLVLKLGLLGGALGWLLYNVWGYVYLAPRIVRECLQLPVVSWYLHAARMLGLAAATYGAGWLYMTDRHSFSVYGWTLTYFVATLAFVVGSLLLMGEPLRITLLKVPGALRRRAGPALSRRESELPRPSRR